MPFSEARSRRKGSSRPEFENVEDKQGPEILAKLRGQEEINSFF